MYTNKSNKFLLFVVFALLAALLLAMTVMPVLAEDEEEEEPPSWWDKNNQIIGYIVAGIIGVGMLVSIYFWIPKDSKKKKKTQKPAKKASN